MILCDSEIKAMLKLRQLSISPAPPLASYTTTAVDLRLGGAEFKRWQIPSGPGVVFEIDPSQKGWFPNCAQFLTDISADPDGSVLLKPNEFMLAMTLERVALPEESRVAARVEGKSSLARIGLSVHITAPTIHAGFKGNITLEIKNHGPATIRLRPEMPICQLIFGTVFGTPSIVMEGLFQDQNSVAGGSP